ncbi:hypothetical protein C7H84_33945 [Burkholderia sp. Nafp2/4-1b]|nr:hypothetical protein C7H84_33945 [Burkholderia sp. Nafp2/4-1b]
MIDFQTGDADSSDLGPVSVAITVFKGAFMFLSSPSDLRPVLEQLPEWKQILEIVKEIDTLKQRIDILEQALQRAPQANQCPRCRELSYRLRKTEPDPTFATSGMQRRVYQCGACDYTEHRLFN